MFLHKFLTKKQKDTFNQKSKYHQHNRKFFVNISAMSWFKPVRFNYVRVIGKINFLLVSLHSLNHTSIAYWTKFSPSSTLTRNDIYLGSKATGIEPERWCPFTFHPFVSLIWSTWPKPFYKKKHVTIITNITPYSLCFSYNTSKIKYRNKMYNGKLL